MPGPHKGLSTQSTTQQQHAKPRHQPSDRDQQARDRLRNKVSESKAKFKAEHTYNWAQQTFDPDIPVILHLPALTTTTDTDTIPNYLGFKKVDIVCPLLIITLQTYNQIL